MSNVPCFGCGRDVWHPGVNNNNEHTKACARCRPLSFNVNPLQLARAILSELDGVQV